MTLNPAQQAAVTSTAALKIVIAGPGSGKTRTMVSAVKMAALRMEFECKRRIAVMTFTNAGANEFRQRLGDTDLVYCGTLHGYCFKLIQRFGGFLGYIPGKVGILPDAERIPRLLACRDKLGSKVSQKKLLDVSRKNCSSEETLIWQEYEFLLKRNNLVDYDVILSEAVELMAMSEVKCQIKLDYLFVDEYQDSAAIDQVIYDGIPATNKMYVGDPDQSIFAFRGAYSAGLTNMALAPKKGVEVHKLELNYRSDMDICTVANQLIMHNRERVEKLVVPVSTDIGSVSVFAHEDVGQELAWLMPFVSAAHSHRRTVAVLYRMNHDVKMCRDYLVAMGIPVQAPKFEQRPADWERAKLILALCQSPDNEILAERLLNLDHTRAVIDRWILEARASGRTLLQMGLYPVWALSENWIYPNGLWQILAQHGRVSESTINLIKERMSMLAPDAELSDLLHDLHSNEDTKEAATEGVYVGTIHSAKGREWDVVFLPAFEQGILPHVSKRDDPNDRWKGISAVEAMELEEERRLAFVAVTRARHELYISHCAYRKGPWGPVGLGQPSQFIKEMGL